MPLADILSLLHHHPAARIALVCHARPDGDALGSAAGLAHILNSQGWKTTLINLGEYSARLRFLTPRDLVASTPTDEWWRDHDILGVLDCGEESRLDPVNRPAARHLPAFTVDHHLSSTKGLGNAVWIDPAASSTGEMVVSLCHEAGWPLSPLAAQALWTAIVTDTGRFSFENTTAKALECATACVKAGANPAAAAEALYQSVTMAERMMQQKVLERMTLHDNGRLAVSWLAREDFIQIGIGAEGADNGINVLRDTAGVDAAVFFYEPVAKPGVVKASFRTRSPLNALDVVTQFGGGGHARAAGCSVTGSLPTVRENVVKATRAAFFQV